MTMASDALAQRRRLLTNFTASCAAPAVSVGRMMETAGNLRSRKTVGSGMIRATLLQPLVRSGVAVVLDELTQTCAAHHAATSVRSGHSETGLE